MKARDTGINKPADELWRFKIISDLDWNMRYQIPLSQMRTFYYYYETLEGGNQDLIDNPPWGSIPFPERLAVLERRPPL